eukprot:2675342-Amphidinium_carterae.1
MVKLAQDRGLRRGRYGGNQEMTFEQQNFRNPLPSPWKQLQIDPASIVTSCVLMRWKLALNLCTMETKWLPWSSTCSRCKLNARIHDSAESGSERSVVLEGVSVKPGRRQESLDREVARDVALHRLKWCNEILEICEC